MWIDLETTGLEPSHNTGLVLEAALVVTNARLGILWKRSWVVAHKNLNIMQFDPGVVAMHSKNGLWADVAASETPLSQVADEMLGNLISSKDWPNLDEKPVLCGSSITFERQWLRFWMRKVYDRLHYRSIDVSSFKEVVQRQMPEEAWYPKVAEEDKAHRALPDILESINELRYYYELFGING